MYMYVYIYIYICIVIAQNNMPARFCSHFNNPRLNRSHKMVMACLRHVVICSFQVKLWKLGC